MPEEVKRESRFDERRKELHVHTTQPRDLKDGEKVIGKGIFEATATYNEEGIRKIYGDAQKDRTNLEQAIKRCKDSAGKKPTNEELKELKDHNKKQKRLKEIGDYEKNQENFKVHKDKLKEVNEAINEIKGAVGDRLKL